ncbi:hypothetical protein [Streptomyces sp. NPDC101145]|uniref:hypothetical protein n=1 Tax=Streptomyces sp. NPDC101145 TaxID=3366112 RepID=UPI0037F29782
MPTPVTLNIRRACGDIPAFPDTVDLDTLTPKARALAEAIHASSGHQARGVVCATGLTEGDDPNFAYKWGNGPEAAARRNRPVTMIFRPTRLRADSEVTAEGWLETQARTLGLDVYPITGMLDPITPLKERVPSAGAAAEDRCLSRDAARSRLAQDQGLVMSPNLWSRLMSAGHLPEPRHYALGGQLPLWHVDDIDAYGTRDYEQWTISEVAEHLGYQGASATGSARKQLSRWELYPVGRAPGRTGENLYPADQVRALHAARPGRGRHGAARDGGKFTTG